MARHRFFSLRHRAGVRRGAPGSVPGGLQTSATLAPKLRLLGYGPSGFDEQTVDSLNNVGVSQALEKWPVTWIDVDGPPDQRLLEMLQETLAVHPLALEDVVNQGQRPKVERYLDQHFIVVYMLTLGERLEVEQLSLFLGHRYVLTFQGSQPSDSLEPVRQRIRSGLGRVRSSGSDYLVYALIDSVIDHYFPIADALGARLEALEEAVLKADSPDVMGRVHALKRDLFQFRRLLWPLGEALNSLNRTEDPSLTKETRLFLRDCSDHVDQLKDLVEVYRETAETLVETYLSVVSNRTSDVMRFLTLVATVFIPLTFLAGVYGMNFDTSVSAWNMPELQWKYGYPAALGSMLLVALGLYRYFKHRRWLR